MVAKCRMHVQNVISPLVNGIYDFFPSTKKCTSAVLKLKLKNR